MIEWYDFYIFGSLAPIIATQFFPKENPTAAFLATLAAFGVGFAQGLILGFEAAHLLGEQLFG